MILATGLFSAGGEQPTERRMAMRTTGRMLRWLVAAVLVSMAGILPSCGTMGGGGMKYLVDPPSSAAESAST